MRTHVTETNDLLDEQVLQETLASLNDGEIRPPVDTRFSMVFEEGTWRICPQLPGPGAPTAPPWLLPDEAPFDQ